MIERINDTFVAMEYFDSETDNKDEAEIYLTKDMVSLNPSNKDRLFRAHCVIYNLKTGKKYEDIDVRQTSDVDACGESIVVTFFVGRGYSVDSNKEKGLGRPDILLKDKKATCNYY